MRKLGVNENILDIIDDFLQRRKQCVKLNECFSEYINVFVGAPQGTKLGPILWLFYVNDLELDNFSVIKYADDTSFYKAFDKHGGSVSQAISHTQQWADDNFMLLNPEKTVIINFLINYKHVYDQVVVLNNDVSIFPSKEVKFLGVTLDDHLTFSSHVDNIVSSCNSKLYLLRN